MKNQLKAGVILSYLTTGISIVIQLVYMPVMIRLLGQSEFGLYTLVSGVVSYLSLFSLGFTGAYLRFFARENQKNDREGLAALNGNVHHAVSCAGIGGAGLRPYAELFSKAGIRFQIIRRGIAGSQNPDGDSCGEYRNGSGKQHF